MKSLLISAIMLISTFTHSQKFPVADTGVTVTVNKSEVSVNIPEFHGTVTVSYYLKSNKKKVYITGEYTNMRGFTDYVTLPPGKYVIVVKKDGSKIEKKEFSVI